MKNKYIIAILAVFLLYGSPITAQEEQQQNSKPIQKVEQAQKLPEAETASNEITDKEINGVIKSGIEENQYLALEKCIRIALANNPTIKAAISNTEIFKSRVGKARSNYFPSLNINNNFGVNNQASFIGAFDQTMTQFDIINIGVSQLLWDFGKTNTNIQIQKLNFNAEESMLKRTVDNTIFNVKQAYYRLLLAFHREDVNTESVDQYKQQLEQAKAFYESGTRPKIDVLTAEVNYSNAKLELIKAKNNVAIAYANLNNVMGLPESPDYKLKNKLSYEDQNIDFEELIPLAYENRPDFKSAMLKVEASKKEVKLAKKDYWPTLSGNAGYNLATFDSDTISSETDNGWRAGVGLDIPVLNFYSTKKKVDEAKASYDKEISQAQGLKNDLYFQVKQTYMEFIESQNSVPTAEVALKQAKEQYDLAQGRYEVGVGNPIELKDAEVTYRNAKLAYYNALYDYNVALAKLENVVGNKLD